MVRNAGQHPSEFRAEQAKERALWRCVSASK
ncbi:hypothetical protein T03_11181 [Trichinella britovi]|uniref:Uncharacterized protein n=1 Tax=Trichinella britovi TaxID=45882 RepID=A0A0V0YXE1_TRIBR|nr:hypothetical protein T03_11181 [Trichinella britovi]